MNTPQDITGIPSTLQYTQPKHSEDLTIKENVDSNTVHLETPTVVKIADGKEFQTRRAPSHAHFSIVNDQRKCSYCPNLYSKKTSSGILMRHIRSDHPSKLEKIPCRMAELDRAVERYLASPELASLGNNLEPLIELLAIFAPGYKPKIGRTDKQKF